MTGKRIGVLMGGLSAEREVSMRSGEAVWLALTDRGHDVVKVFVDRDLDVAVRQTRIDVAFLALHGRYGEDGCVQGLLELFGVPYTGSSVLASALAMDKARAKEVFRQRNLPTPSHYVYDRGGTEAASAVEQHGSFGFPVVVKPCCQGSSLGVSAASDEAELEAAFDLALRFDDRVLVERFAPGTEVCVAVLGGQALGAAEVATRSAVYGYHAKYSNRRDDVHIPPRLGRERYRGLLDLAVAAHHALGCSGLSCVDMIVSEVGNELVLEVNSLPALEPAALVPKIAHAAGLELGDLFERVLAEARLHATGASPEPASTALPAAAGLAAGPH
jgi:D-alanine-D-alanine ligase